MEIKQAHKQAIRAHWPQYRLRFAEDGTVLAQKSIGSAWGILYTPSETAAHIATLEGNR